MSEEIHLDGATGTAYSPDSPLGIDDSDLSVAKLVDVSLTR